MGTSLSIRDAAARGQDCRLISAKRVPVVLDNGRQIYVEPQTVVRSGSRLLVAGFPSYVWGGPGNSVKKSSNTLFGMIVSEDGKAKTIPSPLGEGHLSDARAVDAPNGQWAAIFADVAPDTHFGQHGGPHFNQYWFGITDGSRWMTLEKLPTIHGKVVSGLASKLVRTRDGYSFAVPVELDRVNGQRQMAAAVYSRGSSGWKAQQKVFRYVLYVALDTTEAGNLMLGVVRSDEVFNRINNELGLFTFANSDSSWHEIRRLTTGPSNRLFYPGIAWSGHSLNAFWLQEGDTPGIRQAVAALDIEGNGDPHFAMISADALQVAPVSGSSRPAWIALERRDSASRRIIFASAGDANLSSRFAIPDPFLGYLGAAAFGKKLLIVGPRFSKDGKSPVVSSHLIAAEVNCHLSGTR